MAEENSSKVEIDMPVNGEEESGLESFNHRIVIGASPLMTEHRILARDPSSRKRGNEKGSITGGADMIMCVCCKDIVERQT